MGLFGFTFVRIKGESMEPMLPSGTIALFRATKSVRRGDVVLVDHPDFGMIVKSARLIGIDDEVALEGLSPASTSPEKLGSVPANRVRGVLLRKLT
ncbi:MAG: S24/S26 family peptidase [Pseudomonadota bacterium]